MRKDGFFLKGLIVFAFAGLSAMPWGMAQKVTVSESNDYEGTVAQAQETMASLFGPNSVLPVPPQIQGTVAVPGFDSKNFQVQEEWIRDEAETPEDHSLKT